MNSKSGTVASKKAVTRTLHRNELRGYRPRKTLQNRHLQARLKYTEENLEKHYAYWKRILWSEQTKLELCCHGDTLYVWTEKWEAYNLKNTVPHNETRWWEYNAVGMLQCVRNWETCQGGRNHKERRINSFNFGLFYWIVNWDRQDMREKERARHAAKGHGGDSNRDSYILTIWHVAACSHTKKAPKK